MKKQQEITFRRADNTDIAHVCALGQSAAFNDDSSPREGFILIPPNRAELAVWINSLQHFYVVEEQSARIGYITCFDGQDLRRYPTLLKLIQPHCGDHPVLYIDSVVITKELRGTGIGTQLYEHLAKTAQSIGYRHLVTAIAITPIRNERSITFHQKVGFREIGTDTLGTPNSFSVMIKNLEQS